MQNSGLCSSIRVAAPALGEPARLVLAAPDVGDAPRLEHGVSLLAQPVEIGLCAVEPPLDDVCIHIGCKVLAAPPLRQQRTHGRARDRDRLGRQGDNAGAIRLAQVGAEALHFRVLIARAGERDKRHLPEQIPKIMPLLERREHIRADDEIQLRIRIARTQLAHSVGRVALAGAVQLYVGDLHARLAGEGQHRHEQALRRLRAARRELLVRRDTVRDDKRQIRPDRRAHRAQRGRMSQMWRVEAAAIDADLHFFAFFTSSIFGFCSLRL